MSQQSQGALRCANHGGEEGEALNIFLSTLNLFVKCLIWQPLVHLP